MSRPLQAVMFKIQPPTIKDYAAPLFLTVDSEDVHFWRKFGWFLLADESEIGDGGQKEDDDDGA